MRCTSGTGRNFDLIRQHRISNLNPEVDSAYYTGYMSALLCQKGVSIYIVCISIGLTPFLVFQPICFKSAAQWTDIMDKLFCEKQQAI